MVSLPPTFFELLLYLPPFHQANVRERETRLGLPLPVGCGTLPLLIPPNKLYKSVDTNAITLKNG